jgi:hypothetical protein
MAEFDQRRSARARNRRTGWALAAIALVFFAGSIAARELGPQAGLAAIGLAMFAFVVLAIGSHLLRRR